MRGYVVDEVDEFLDRAAAEVDQIREQMQQMRQQLRQAGERIRQLEGGVGVTPAPASTAVFAPAPAPAPAPTPAPTAAMPVASSTAGAEQVTAMIAMAQQFIDQAQQEAESRAREMTVAAQERAREIVAEARSRAEDEVNRLNGLKQRLSEDVTLLTRQLDSERTRLASVLSELSQWIESSLHVGVNSGAHAAPAPAPAPSPAPAAHPVPATAPTPAASTVMNETPPRPLAPPPAPPADFDQVLGFDQPTDGRA
jgi:cell division septum initiation protein DivIVA